MVLKLPLSLNCFSGISHARGFSWHLFALWVIMLPGPTCAWTGWRMGWWEGERLNGYSPTWHRVP